MTDPFQEAMRKARDEYRRETDSEASSTEGRRGKIAALAEQGATQGEREAARAALSRLDTPTHAENDRMQRGGNWNDG